MQKTQRAELFNSEEALIAPAHAAESCARTYLWPHPGQVTPAGCFNPAVLKLASGLVTPSEATG